MRKTSQKVPLTPLSSFKSPEPDRKWRPLFPGVSLKLLKNSFGLRWADPPQPCGVIAGSKAVTLLNPVGWISNLFGIISRPNDGTIAVEETRLPSMADFCVVHAGGQSQVNGPDLGGRHFDVCLFLFCSCFTGGGGGAGGKAHCQKAVSLKRRKKLVWAS